MKRPDDSIKALLQKAEKDEMIVISYLKYLENERNNTVSTLRQIADRFDLHIDFDKLKETK